LSAFCQQVTRVIVVDSVTFEALPAVFVVAKNSKKSFLADPSGIFTIQTKTSDTLVLSHVGYYPAIIPLFFEEDAIMVRMRPKVTLLEEVVISSRKLYPNELNPRVSKTPETKTVWGTLNQPWEYFNKREKEKRKLVKLMQENDRIKTFIEVVTDPSIKDELMEDYAIEETEYYDILVRFNRQKFPVIYTNDSEKIIEALHDFFEKETQ
jgi:CarboxypepD_reg-like domain